MVTKDLIKNWFGIDDTNFTKLIESAKELLNNLEVELDESDFDNDDEETESYYHSMSKSYDNGKLVKKSEKEYVNGECTKDEEFDATKSLESESTKCNNDNDDSKCCKNKNRTYKRLKEKDNKLAEKCDAYVEQMNEMARHIDTLNDRIKELEKENRRLSTVVNNVKNCF